MASSHQNRPFWPGFLPASIASFALLFVVPSFVRLYESFGAELPNATVLLFRWHRVIALLPFLFLVSWCFWPNRNARGTAALLSSLLLSGALLGVGALAAYAPLINLGSAP